MHKQIATIKCAQWDKVYSFEVTDFNVHVGDFVICEIPLGLSLGKIVKIVNVQNINSEIIKIKRIASEDDLLNYAKQNLKKQEAIDYCKKSIQKFNLAMKLFDVHFSIDEKRITFAFIANGRIDFRELVKELAQYFQKSIRLQQIGVRDETKLSSDIGICGQRTCCTRFLGELGNVNSTYAEKQQISHRGAERLSGVCGRLVCCLKYEQDMYEQLSKTFPEIGTEVKLKDGSKGIVKEVHILNKIIGVHFKDKEGIVDIPLEEIKK